VSQTVFFVLYFDSGEIKECEMVRSCRSCLLKLSKYLSECCETLKDEVTN
jgi:hypothetical protein